MAVTPISELASRSKDASRELATASSAAKDAALLIAAFAFAAVCAGALALPGYRQDLKVLSALALSVRRTRGSA